MTVYDPYTNTFYDITSDKTMIPVQSLKKLEIEFGIHYRGSEPPWEEPCEDVIKEGIM